MVFRYVIQSICSRKDACLKNFQTGIFVWNYAEQFMSYLQ
ncbi:hypothetical protein HMPREF9370_0739 [Neisseria wadsworthii 9715]|uniref:Uncharacterized protein n=1 Tax=Neisseria wadsworthii 9715 TaxID=1030841 RepID=G4CNT0_9NEIS|nr:hypothetical protein HMPREF9370_0739 [Neisseria wadsworthii 9715]